MSDGIPTFRVFVSSTFGDMQREREALRRQTFRQLANYCRSRGAHFQEIDLRWGVSASAGRDQQTMRICLEELQRCRSISPRPNFLILLGDRYGWRPLPSQIEADEFALVRNAVTDSDALARLDYWYQLDKNAIPRNFVLQSRSGDYADDVRWRLEEMSLHLSLRKAAVAARLPKDKVWKYFESATHQEIRAGALAHLDAKEHVFCYLRSFNDSPTMDDSQSAGFVDTVKNESKLVRDADAVVRLRALKQELTELLPEQQVFAINPQRFDALTDAHIDDLCNRVYRHLQSVIDNELARRDHTHRSHDLETRKHAEFGRRRSRWFHGRGFELDRISEYLESTSQYPFLVHGESGSGKTALLARAARALRVRHRRDDALILVRYLGATPESMSTRSLLLDLCGRLAPISVSTVKPPTEYRELVRDFARRLENVATTQKTVIFLDSLDQLESGDMGRRLGWLPRELPSNVKIVISTVDDEGDASDCFRWASGFIPQENQLRVPPLAEKEAAALLKTWLTSVHRDLQPPQRNYVLRQAGSNPLPLWLRLAFETAKRWPSYLAPSPLPSHVSDLLDAMLHRLEDDAAHGRRLVERALGYLATGRHGLSEEELLDLLSLDRQVVRDYRRRSPQSPDFETDATGSEAGLQPTNASNANDAIVPPNIPRRVPPILWARLRADLEPYLMGRGVNGIYVLSFYHRQVRQSVERRYLAAPLRRILHRRIARYFFRQPFFVESLAAHRDRMIDDPGDGVRVQRRKIAELAYQWIRSGRFDAAENSLTDIALIEAMCESGVVYDYLRDCDDLLSRQQSSTVRSWRDAIASVASAIARHPADGFSASWNRLRLERLGLVNTAQIESARRRLEERSAWLEVMSPPVQARFVAPTIDYGTPSRMQCFVRRNLIIGIAGSDGQLELIDLEMGDVIEYRLLPTRDITAIALEPTNSSAAWHQADGVIQSEQSHASMIGRASDRVILHLDLQTILAVNADHELVHWNPVTNECRMIVKKLPAPLLFMRGNDKGDRVFFVAGQSAQELGWLCLIDGQWQSEPLEWKGAPVVHAAISPDGDCTLLASRDRSITIVNKNRLANPQCHYERRGEAAVQGLVEAAVVVSDDNREDAYFVTTHGHLARWSYPDDTLQLVNTLRTRKEEHFVCLLEPLDENRLYISTPARGHILSVNETSKRDAPRHGSAVTACCVTAGGSVVSISEEGTEVRWWTDTIMHLHCQMMGDRRPSVLASLSGEDGVLVGTVNGEVWRFAATPGPFIESFRLFSVPVVGLFPNEGRSVTAASSQGQIIEVDWLTEAHTTHFMNTMAYRQRQLLAGPSERGASYYCVREETFGDLVCVVVAGIGPEREIILRRDVESTIRMAVGEDATNVCLATRRLEICAFDGRSLVTRFQRDALHRYNHVAFLDADRYLAAINSEEQMLEVIRIGPNLPTVARAPLPAQAGCVTARGNLIVVGFVDGSLSSYRLHARAAP